MAVCNFSRWGVEEFRDRFDEMKKFYIIVEIQIETCLDESRLIHNQDETNLSIHPHPHPFCKLCILRKNLKNCALLMVNLIPSVFCSYQNFRKNIPLRFINITFHNEFDHMKETAFIVEIRN